MPSVDSSRFVYRNESITPLSPFEVKVGVYNTEGEGALSAMSVIYSGEDGECSQHGAGLLEAQRRLLPLSWNRATKAGCVFLWMAEPQLAPRGTSVQSFSASEMEVSWNAIAWNRNTGRVLGYEVMPRISLSLAHVPTQAPGQQACPATQLWGHHMSV